MKKYWKDIVKQLDKKANTIARKAGYGKATDYKLGIKNKVTERTEPGYYKNTTKEQVPFAYIKNYGWKNCRYVCAYTVVELDVRKLSPIEIYAYFREVLSPLDTLTALETLTSMTSSITEDTVSITAPDRPPYRQFILASNACMHVYTTHNQKVISVQLSLDGDDYM